MLRAFAQPVWRGSLRSFPPFSRAYRSLPATAWFLARCSGGMPLPGISTSPTCTISCAGRRLREFRGPPMGCFNGKRNWHLSTIYCRGVAATRQPRSSCLPPLRSATPCRLSPRASRRRGCPRSRGRISPVAKCRTKCRPGARGASR